MGVLDSDILKNCREKIPFLDNLTSIYGGFTAFYRRKSDIDKYDSIETRNKLILKFFDYKLKGIGQFTPEKTY